MRLLAVIGLIMVSLLIVNKFVLPFKKMELWGIYKMYSMGSGMDDGAYAIFMSHKYRYKSIVLEMLDNSEVGSFNAEGSFLFADLLLDDLDIKSKVVELSQSHPEKEIRCFWHDVVNGRFEEVDVSDNSSSYGIYRMIDNGSTCE